MLTEYVRALNLDLERFASKSKLKSKLFALITVQGAWAVAVYRFGNISLKYSKQNRIYKFNIIIWYVLNKIIEILTGISIDYRAKIGKRLLISHFGNIIVSGNSQMGDNCNLSQGVTLGRNASGSPIVGNDCYIGAGSMLIGGIKIGDNSKIGALALVNKSFPENSLLVGNPAINKARTTQ